MFHQVFVAAQRFDPRQEIEVAERRVEREVASERERSRVDHVRKVWRGAAEPWLKFLERRCQPLKVAGRATVAQVDVVSQSRTAEEVFGLAAYDEKLHAVFGEQTARGLKARWVRFA